MLKIRNIELTKLGQSFLDEIEDPDYGNDRKRRSPYTTDLTPPVPRGDQGIIGEEEFEQFEPGTSDQPVRGSDVPPEEQQQPEGRDEIPLGSEELGIPEDTPEIEYPTGNQLAYEGIDNQEVITFEYTNRFGQYAGTRTVEPHYTFVASTTGNEVLVSWDRDADDIRAFIVGNIHPYGVRYEGATFEPKGEIMRGIY